MGDSAPYTLQLAMLDANRPNPFRRYKGGSCGGMNRRPYGRLVRSDQGEGMDGVLGIDAAWTAEEPSGVALLAGSSGGWRCVTFTPSYDSFLALAEGMPVDWTLKAKGAIPKRPLRAN
jgi:hypothetical protein